MNCSAKMQVFVQSGANLEKKLLRKLDPGDTFYLFEFPPRPALVVLDVVRKIVKGSRNKRVVRVKFTDETLQSAFDWDLRYEDDEEESSSDDEFEPTPPNVLTF